MLVSEQYLKVDTISTDSISLFDHRVLIIWADKSVEI